MEFDDRIEPQNELAAGPDWCGVSTGGSPDALKSPTVHSQQRGAGHNPLSGQSPRAKEIPMTQLDFLMAIIGMSFVILLLTGIFWYGWRDSCRKERFKLQKERETTLRELNAYVAEGSITPENAERLIRAMSETDHQEVCAVGVVQGSCDPHGSPAVSCPCCC